jgi:hypothetical protein
MKATRSLGVVLTAALGSTLAIACSQETGDSEGKSAAELHLCVLDGAVCVDLPDVVVPPLPFDGGLPFTDAGFPQLPDVGTPPLPPWLDAGFPGFDGGFAWPDSAFPFPGNGYGFDAGAGSCDLSNPKYSQEYVQEVQSGTATPCGACSATECCFATLACVAQ